MRLYRHFACYIQKATVLNRGFYFIFPAPAAIVRSAVYYTLQYVGQFVEFVAVAAFYKYGTPAYVAGLYGVFHFRFILEGAVLWRNAAEVFSHEPFIISTVKLFFVKYLTPDGDFTFLPVCTIFSSSSPPASVPLQAASENTINSARSRHKAFAAAVPVFFILPLHLPCTNLR